MLIPRPVERLPRPRLAPWPTHSWNYRTPRSLRTPPEDWLGLSLSRGDRGARNKRLAPVARSAAAQPPFVRGLLTAPIAASTAPCSASSPSANGPRAPTWVMIGPTASASPWLLALSATVLPRGPLGTLTACSRLFADLAQALVEGRLPR